MTMPRLDHDAIRQERDAGSNPRRSASAAAGGAAWGVSFVLFGGYSADMKGTEKTAGVEGTSYSSREAGLR